MNEKGTVVTGGVGFTGLLTLLFIALKLTHVIDWSWLWVLAPLWISVVFSMILIISMLLYVYGGDLMPHRRNKRK